MVPQERAYLAVGGGSNSSSSCLMRSGQSIWSQTSRAACPSLALPDADRYGVGTETLRYDSQGELAGALELRRQSHVDLIQARKAPLRAGVLDGEALSP